jgi:glycosyltransferase involved in cell wall biosynthesis
MGPINQNPLVSILIPAYNAEAWIADTIRSAIGQTWRRTEIVVVDDGSRDDTLGVARQFVSDGVSVVAQPNQGAAATRNKAFSLCRGDYIQWLDADDLLAPDKISRQIEALDKCCSGRTLLSSAWGRFIYRSKRAKFSPTSLWCDFLSPTEWLIRKLERNAFMQTGAWLVSRQLTQAAGPWDTRLLGDDDGEYFCRVLIASDGVRFVPEAKVFYRVVGCNRLSHIGRSNEKLDAMFLSVQLYVRYLRSLDDSERARAASLALLRRMLALSYPERLDIVEKLKQMAASLGGKLDSPRLSWKYAWIQRLFGRELARAAQLTLPEFKQFLVRTWDKSLFRLGM